MYRFFKTVETQYSAETARELLKQTQWGDVQYGLCCTDPENLIFEVRTNDLIKPHSFLPRFRLTVEEEETLTKIHITAGLRTSTRVIALAYSAMCIAFQLTMVVMWLRGQLDTSFVMFIPCGLFLFANLMAFSALRLSARPFLKEVCRIFEVHDDN